MADPIFFATPNLWPKIRQMLKHTGRHSFVACPYVGKGATSLLPLREGDSLLCALTKANCRAGAVCPSELEKFRRRGVKLYQQHDLHAKVFLIGTKAFVGSANASRSSERNLDEAGVLVNGRGFIRGIRVWFKSRLSEPVSPLWLSECKKAYRPPRVQSKVKRAGRKRSAGERLWLMGLRYVDFPEDEKEVFTDGEMAAKKLAAPRTVIEPIRAVGDSRRYLPGDIIVQLYKTSKVVGPEALPHGKLLNVKHTRTKRGARVQYLYLEMPREYKTIPWKRFGPACRSLGLKVKKGIDTREIRSRSIGRALLALVSPEKLAKK